MTATESVVEYLPTLIMERRAIVRMSMRPTTVAMDFGQITVDGQLSSHDGTARCATGPFLCR